MKWVPKGLVYGNSDSFVKSSNPHARSHMARIHNQSTLERVWCCSCTKMSSVVTTVKHERIVHHPSRAIFQADFIDNGESVQTQSDASQGWKGPNEIDSLGNPSQGMHYLECCTAFHPICYLRPFLVLLPPSRNSDPGLHSRHISPLPTTVRALLPFLSREGFSTFFPRRLVSNCAYPRYVYYFVCII